MLAGAAELGLVSGKLKSEHWKLCVPVAFAVSGAAFLIHEANPWLYSRSAFVHHVVRLDAAVGALFPLGAAFKPRSLRVQRRATRSCSSRSRSRSTRSRDVAPVFGHLDPDRGGGAPVRRLLAVAARRRARVPGAALGARDAAADARRRSAQRLGASPRVVRARVRPEREGAPERDPGLRREGQARLRARRACCPATRAPSRCRSGACREGGVHRPLGDDLERQPRRPRRLHVRRARCRRRALSRGVRRLRAEDLGARRPLALLHLPRAPHRRARLPAARAARRRDAGGRAALLPADRRRRGRRARGRDRRVPAPRRGRAPAAVHRRSCTATSRRSRKATRFGAGVRGDGARLRGRRRAALPRVADRAAVAALGRRSCSRSGSAPGSRSRATSPTTAAGCRRSPTGCTCPRRRSGSAGCSRSGSSSGTTASCAGRRSGASPRSPGRSSRSSSRPAST